MQRDPVHSIGLVVGSIESMARVLPRAWAAAVVLWPCFPQILCGIGVLVELAGSALSVVAHFVSKAGQPHALSEPSGVGLASAL